MKEERIELLFKYMCGALGIEETEKSRGAAKLGVSDKRKQNSGACR